jgi:hypothetical protein
MVDIERPVVSGETRLEAVRMSLRTKAAGGQPHAFKRWSRRRSKVAGERLAWRNNKQNEDQREGCNQDAKKGKGPA